MLVDVPERGFLMVDGRGDPNTSREYAEALQALYSVSYTAKFALEHAGILDYAVMPLEGLWWSEDMATFPGIDKSASRRAAAPR